MKTTGVYVMFFFEGYGDHRDLHNAQHSFPARRSSDLVREDAFDRPLERARIRVEPLVPPRSEEHTSGLQSLCVISYAVFCLQKKNSQLEFGYSAFHPTPNTPSTETQNT